jgi:hypothetical protein
MLPVTRTSFPGCALRSLTALATSPCSSVEFCHSTASRVVDTTTFGALFMNAAGPASPWWGQKAANSS